MIKALIKGGSDISRTDNIDDTALHLAAYWGNCEAVELLLREGASPHVSNSFGHTPLGMAVFANRTKAANLLREAVGEPAEAYQSTNPFSEWDGEVSDLERVTAKPPWDAGDLYNAAGGKEELEKKVSILPESPLECEARPRAGWLPSMPSSGGWCASGPSLSNVLWIWLIGFAD